MDYRRLGRSGLKVSRLCLGAMMFGDRADEAGSAAIFDKARDAGINFIDTADTYADGRSEEIVGRLVRRDRDSWVVATKVGNPNGPGANSGGLSRRWLLQEVPASLRRLGTDYIDILYLHRDDYETPTEETVRALEALQSSGMIRYFGVSNFRAWRIAVICAACDQAGIGRPVVAQPLYHVLNRTAETEVLPSCAHFGLGVVGYSPLARGVLTGKYVNAEPDPASRAGRGDRRILQTEFHPVALEAARWIAAHAAQRGVSAAAFSVAWALGNRHVSGVIAGPKSLDQLDGYLDGLRMQLDEDDESAVSDIVAPGTTAIPGFVDPLYPVTERN